MLPSLSLPPLECCFGTSPIQAEKFRPDRKAFGSGTLATRAVASAGPTPGIASSRLLVSLDRCQTVIIRSNSKICALSIRSWAPRAARHARAISRHPFVTRVGDDPEQFLDTIAPDRSDDPVLGKMGADRIDHRGLLADEEMARPMEHQAALLLGRLGLDEPHVCPGDRLADSLGVGSIVLLPLDVRLHVGRRHQTHRMPQRFELARPMMRRSTGFDADEARRQPLKEWQNVPALELTANDYITCRVNSVDLKNRLGDIETDCRDRLHVWLLRIVGALTAPTSMALPCRWRSRPQHQKMG